MPTESTPQIPQTPWTDIAPTGSSIPRFSQKKTEYTPRTAGIAPIRTADHDGTNAHGAVMATNPASIPLAPMDGSYLPNFSFINIMAQNAPPADASMVLVAMTPMRILPAPTAPRVE